MIIDIIVAAVLILSAIISFFRGFIRETLTIAGVAGGGFAAITFGPMLSPTFQGWFGIVEGEEVTKLFDIVPMTIIANLCAYAVIFVGVVIAISVISHFTAGAAKAMGLGPIDRTFGVIFGLIRGVLLLGLLYLPFHLLMDEAAKNKYFGDSQLHIYVEKTADFIAGFLPSSKEVEDTASDVVDSAVNGVKDGTIKQQLFQNNMLSNGKDNQKKSVTPSVDKSTQDNHSAIGYDKIQRDALSDLMAEPTFNE